MSFATIRSTAYSALSAAQVLSQVAASNIANADTEGYTKKSAETRSVVLGGTGSGVSLGNVTSGITRYLVAALVAARTEAGTADANADYMDRLQQALGSTSGSDDTGTSIAQGLADLETALSDLLDDPTSDTLKAQFVAALDGVASDITSLSQSVQSLRGDADSEIADSVAAVNTALTTIADLNAQILTARTQGHATADLEDKRNTALAEVATYLDIRAATNANGGMSVSLSDGTLLVGTEAHLLSFSDAGTAAADTIYRTISVGGKAISPEAGKIGALLTLRDEALPEVQESLDALAAGLIDALNAAYEDAGGTELLTGTDATDISVSDALVDTPSELAVSSVDDVQGLLDALTGGYAFAAAGGLAAGTRSFADYATAIVGKVATDAASAESQAGTADAALSAAEDAISSATGVNVDEETARLSELEQYYSVAAQIITTLNAMFDALLTAAKSA